MKSVNLTRNWHSAIVLTVCEHSFFGKNVMFLVSVWFASKWGNGAGPKMSPARFFRRTKGILYLINYNWLIELFYYKLKRKLQILIYNFFLLQVSVFVLENFALFLRNIRHVCTNEIIKSSKIDMIKLKIYKNLRFLANFFLI